VLRFKYKDTLIRQTLSYPPLPCNITPIGIPNITYCIKGLTNKRTVKKCYEKGSDDYTQRLETGIDPNINIKQFFSYHDENFTEEQRAGYVNRIVFFARNSRK
jgi:hypothetical protein